MKWDAFKYLYPPRPASACPPNLLRHYQERGFWHQAKMNGTNCTLYVDPNRYTVAYGRHGPHDILSRWRPGERWNRFAARLPGKGWHVLCAELLHVKGSAREGVSDTLYLHDLLVFDGGYLVGQTYEQRYTILLDLVMSAPHYAGEPGPSHHYTHEEAMPGVWIAANWKDGRWLLEGGLPGYVEGVVMKDPKAPLRLCSTPTANAGWQAKCRRATDHLSF